MTALDEQGMRESTLVIFSSDNGGPGPGRVTMNTPLRAGKGTIYEGGVRVCACVNWPGKIPAGATVREPLHGVDWYPTLLKLAGAAAEQKTPVDGLDLWPVLTQGAKSPHDAILLAGMAPGRAAIRMGDWKLHVSAGDVELYNLAEDIGEKVNLAEAQPEKVEELRGRLAAFQKGAVKNGGPAPEPKRRKRQRAATR
jgi:arylsulfatase A-like enzyme